MPWGKCDDRFWKHAKVQALAPSLRAACAGLYWQAISWSNDVLSDGRIPAAMPGLLGARRVHVEELVRVGLWERDGKAFLVHDFHDFNKTRDQVEAERALKADIGRKGAEARWGSNVVRLPLVKEGGFGWGAAWTAFAEAWHARGFRKPPSPKQRETLWPIVDARPTDAAKWVAAAPDGASPFDAVQHVLKAWGRKMREAA